MKTRIEEIKSMPRAFTRLFDSAGFNYSTASNIVGERVPFRYTDNGWEHVYTPYDSVVERYRHRLEEADFEDGFKMFAMAGGAFTFPITGLILPVMAAEQGEDVGLGIMIYLMGSTIWLMLAAMMSVPFV